ncbi:MAG: RNA polymerase sigma factor [Acidimicrobiia bacterium]|nr:RNA polymerase sigma factor [Acidimicrobiia bacterium]
MQEAFLSLCRNWDHVADPRSYLYGTVIRRSRDHVRGITRRRSLLERLVSAHGPPAAGGEGGGEGEGEGPSPIDLSALRPRHREAIVLHYYLDLPVDEVAALLDRPVGTIKTWLSRGRKELRPLLAARSPT